MGIARRSSAANLRRSISDYDPPDRVKLGIWSWNCCHLSEHCCILIQKGEERSTSIRFEDETSGINDNFSTYPEFITLYFTSLIEIQLHFILISVLQISAHHNELPGNPRSHRNPTDVEVMKFLLWCWNTLNIVDSISDYGDEIRSESRLDAFCSRLRVLNVTTQLGNLSIKKPHTIHRMHMPLLTSPSLSSVISNKSHWHNRPANRQYSCSHRSSSDFR